MAPSVEQCAWDVLETVPVAMRYIHCYARVRRLGGLSLVQLRALGFLSRARKASLSAVAEYLGLSLPALSRLIDGLVKKQLVERRIGSTDRRQVALTPTARGLRRLEAARAQMHQHLTAALRTLSPGERTALEEGLQVLHRVFQPSCETPPAQQKS